MNLERKANDGETKLKRPPGSKPLDELSAFDGTRKAVNVSIDKICDFTGQQTPLCMTMLMITPISKNEPAISRIAWDVDTDVAYISSCSKLKTASSLGFLCDRKYSGRVVV